MNENEKTNAYKGHTSTYPENQAGGSQIPRGEGNQEQQSQVQQEPTQTGGQKGSDVYTQPTKELCVKKDPIKDTLDKQKWGNQLEQIESQCDQALKTCLAANDDALLKLYNDISDAVGKYGQEYNKLKQQIECMKKTNESALEDMSDSVKEEIGPLIDRVSKKVITLKKCRDKLECLAVKNGYCDDANYTPIEQKPDIELNCIELNCKDENIPNLMTLKQAFQELDKSSRYHDIKEEEFNELKATQTSIQGNLKKITDYQKEADRARQEGKSCVMYAYTLMIQKTLEDINFYPINDLETRLKCALDNLRKAKTDKCIREYVKCKAEAMLNLVNQSLDEAEKTRDEAILAKIVSTQM